MSTQESNSARTFPDGRPYDEQPRWWQDFPIDIPEDDFLARREFTKFLVLTSGAFVAGQGWIATMSLMHSDETFQEIPIAREEDVMARKVIEFRYPTDHQPCLLLHLNDGRLVAYGQQCSHLSCAVIPDVENGYLHCPCHKGYFEINDGRPIAGPPRRPLTRIRIKVQKGTVYATGVEARTV
jgi:Rieske Fe-S protein